MTEQTLTGRLGNAVQGSLHGAADQLGAGVNQIRNGLGETFGRDRSFFDRVGGLGGAVKGAITPLNPFGVIDGGMRGFANASEITQSAANSLNIPEGGLAQLSNTISGFSNSLVGREIVGNSTGQVLGFINIGIQVVDDVDRQAIASATLASLNIPGYRSEQFNLVGQNGRNQVIHVVADASILAGRPNSGDSPSVYYLREEIAPDGSSRFARIGERDIPRDRRREISEAGDNLSRQTRAEVVGLTPEQLRNRVSQGINNFLNPPAPLQSNSSIGSDYPNNKTPSDLVDQIIKDHVIDNLVPRSRYEPDIARCGTGTNTLNGEPDNPRVINEDGLFYEDPNRIVSTRDGPFYEDPNRIVSTRDGPAHVTQDILDQLGPSFHTSGNGGPLAAGLTGAAGQAGVDTGNNRETNPVQKQLTQNMPDPSL